MSYMTWRRELAVQEAQKIALLRETREWSQAMQELAFSEADLREDFHNVRMVAVRAQQLREAK